MSTVTKINTLEEASAAIFECITELGNEPFRLNLQRVQAHVVAKTNKKLQDYMTADDVPVEERIEFLSALVDVIRRKAFDELPSVTPGQVSKAMSPAKAAAVALVAPLAVAPDPIPQPGAPIESETVDIGQTDDSIAEAAPATPSPRLPRGKLSRAKTPVAGMETATARGMEPTSVIVDEQPARLPSTAIETIVRGLRELDAALEAIPNAKPAATLTEDRVREIVVEVVRAELAKVFNLTAGALTKA